MSDNTLDYPRLLQEAVLSVVRHALRVAADDGLPGDHHFYLTFRTGAPGVRIPAALRQRFTDEMTIVIQHQYWNLAVDDERLAVTLRFGGAPEHLEVPFAALTAFADPSVSFGLRFDAVETGAPVRNANAPAALGPRPVVAAPKPGARRPAAAPRARRGTTKSAATKATSSKSEAARSSDSDQPPAGMALAARERTTTKVVDFTSFRRAATEPPSDKPREP